jgi:hypothetical protein
MIKLKTIVIILLVYVISFLSLRFDINLLYPYYYIKDLFFSPVNAVAKDEEIKQFLSDYKNNKGWRDLLRKKLSDKELEYLTSITKSKVRAKINN